MERIIPSLLLISLSTDFFIESFPIKNGFSVKFKPLSSKEGVHPKTFGALFAKISQELTPEAILRRELFSKLLPDPPPELGAGCSNQVARMLLPVTYEDNSNNTHWKDGNYLNLPIIKQPYKDYKILVVTAPPDLKIGQTEEDKKVVIYVVFPHDDTEANTSSVTIPEIYFVNKPHESLDHKGKVSRPDPVILVDSNRTITGLKSKHVEKLLKFKNKLLRRYNYEVTS